MSTPLRWRKSSLTNTTNCVELAWPADSAAIRDSKNPAPTLTFTPAQLTDFIITLKVGALAGVQSR